MSNGDAHGTPRVQQLNQMVESPGGKLLWRLGEIIVAAIISFSATQISFQLSWMVDTMKQATNVNIQQDKSLALLEQKNESMERTTDATVATLQALTQQVTHNSDDIGHLKEGLKLQFQRDRPPR